MKVISSKQLTKEDRQKLHRLIIEGVFITCMQFLSMVGSLVLMFTGHLAGGVSMAVINIVLARLEKGNHRERQNQIKTILDKYV